MIDVPDEPHVELPVAELLRRAHPLPPHDQMVIDDLTGRAQAVSATTCA